MNYYKYYSANADAKLNDVMAPLRYHCIRYVSAEQFVDPYDSKFFFETLNGEREDVFSEVINRHLKIACMSRNPISPIMWAHYSSYHAGYVIEYDIHQEAQKKIEYEKIKPFNTSIKKIEEDILKSVPNISASEIKKCMKEVLLADPSYMDNFMKTIFTKHSDWEYEKEYRLIDVDLEGNSANYFYKDIGTEQVNSIILGYKFDHDKYDKELKRILVEVYEGSLEVCKVEPSLDEYIMKIKPYNIRL